jgi:hypothetical protein
MVLDAGLSPIILHLTSDTLEDCIEDGFQHSIKNAESIGAIPPGLSKHGQTYAKAMRHVIAPRLSLMLYLCADNAEVTDQKTGIQTPRLPQKIKDKIGERYLPASLPTTWEAGVRIGAKIRAAEHKEKPEIKGGTHASPAPHWRTFHWHTFRRGPGRSERFIKWLPMLPVGYGDQDPGEGPAVIHDVPEDEGKGEK